MLAYPLPRSKHANFGRQGSPGEHSIRVALFPQLARVRRYVLGKFLQQKVVNDDRLVMGDAHFKAAVERKQMARCARVGESWRLHQFATRGRLWRDKRWRAAIVHQVRVPRFCERGNISKVGIFPFSLQSPRPVAVGTFELDHRTSGAAANGLHVDRVSELHSPRIKTL
jgi:hypothetical protein